MSTSKILEEENSIAEKIAMFNQEVEKPLKFNQLNPNPIKNLI